MLYHGPSARIRTNGCLLGKFQLFRGTRQGCPLSPGLFALAMEPLAILLRADPGVRGLQVGPIEEKLSLYADDALLYLADASSSLQTALDLINRFGGYSGIRINWDKSVLFPLHPSTPRVPHPQLKWVDDFKYLGIKISGKVQDYMDNNLRPLMTQLTARCAAWHSLPLTSVGRVNLLKMIYLPQYLYFFRNTPIPIPRTFFRRLESLLIHFVWAGRPPRVAKQILYLPLSGGGDWRYRIFKSTIGLQFWSRFGGGSPSPRKIRRSLWRQPFWVPLLP